jgi:hypothetical protein
MLLVLCSHDDRAAHAFANRFAKNNLRTVTCAGVSQEGWKLTVRGIGGDAEVKLTAAIGGRRVGCDQIEGVITRLAFVGEKELAHIAAEDRSYVAAEMHAFLFAFLEALPCRIVNPPSLTCLYGPNLRPAQWRRCARELRIPVAEDLGGIGTGSTACSPVDITVIGERTFGKGPEPALLWSKQLAQLVGVSYLLVRYTDVQGTLSFLGADPYPRLESEEIGWALVESFARRTIVC